MVSVAINVAAFLFLLWLAWKVAEWAALCLLALLAMFGFGRAESLLDRLGELSKRLRADHYVVDRLREIEARLDKSREVAAKEYREIAGLLAKDHEQVAEMLVELAERLAFLREA
jgi:hypothetical protein